MYLLQLQQQHESVHQDNILCGMKSGLKLSRRRVNALTNKRDEDQLCIKLTFSECSSLFYFLKFHFDEIT
jgi:hypothetical protein